MNESNFHNYQHASKAHIMENPYCGLFLDMGLGKTVTSLTAINDLIYKELEISGALVIAPKRVAENVWTAEAKKWEHLKHLKIVVIAGTEKQRKAAMREKADVHTIGRDNVAWLCGQFGGSMLPWDMVIIDESSSFKNHQALRFKALKQVQPSLSRVVALTGTPAPNGLIDLWPQLYLLDRGERLGKTITAYRERYFSRSYDGYSYDLREGKDESIHGAISDICISMKAEDYLELPEVIENDIEIIFPPALKKQYDDFEREKVLELLSAHEEITAMNAAGLSVKLRQFAGGAVYDENHEPHWVHDLKLDAVEEVIEGMQGRPLLIGWAFQHERDRLMQRLKKYGAKELKTGKDIDDWNAGKIRVLMAHPASAGHGLNLQDGGSDLLWYNCDWSLELYQQFNKRLARQGQTRKGTLHRLVSKGTIDEDVIAALERKDSTQRGLMDAVKARIDKYNKL